MKHAYAVFAKVLSFVLFGLGGLIIGFIVLPLEKLIIHPHQRFLRSGRLTISGSHRLFVAFMGVLGIVKVSHSDLRPETLKGKIVAPNHPSLLDVVILFSLIPSANCIVRGALVHSPVGAIVRMLYISNREDFPTLLADCTASLKRGDVLIVFPEGTRTRKGQKITLKRGVSCISVSSGAPIVPFFIGGNDKKGLRKHDSLFLVNDEGCFRYTITRGKKEFLPEDYLPLGQRNGTVQMTRDLEAELRK